MLPVAQLWRVEVLIQKRAVKEKIREGKQLHKDQDVRRIKGLLKV